MSVAKSRDTGYQCPVRGRPSKNSKRFTLGGVLQHIKSVHGVDEIKKRMRLGSDSLPKK